MAITIEQARKALPQGYKISDEELTAVIADAYTVANLAVKDYLRSKQRKEVLKNRE